MRCQELFARASAGALVTVLGLALGAGAAVAQTESQPGQNQPSSQSPAPDAPQVTAPAGADAPYAAPEPGGRMSMGEMQERIEEMQRQLDFMKQVSAEQTTGVAATLPNGKVTMGSADGRFTATV